MMGFYSADTTMTPPRLPSLHALHVFEAVGRLLSFTRAAQALHLTRSAVSHQIARLEDELGQKLFVRETRRIRLTPAGAEYLDWVRRAFALLQEGTQAVRAPTRQVLRVSLLASFASHWLVPRLHRFQTQHPDIELQMDPSIRLSQPGVDTDVAIRYGRGDWPGVQGIQIMDEWLTPICSPALLAEGGPWRLPESLLQHNLLFSWSPNALEWSAWSGAFGCSLAGTRQTMLTDYNIVLHGAQSGQGLAMGRLRLLAPLLAQGSLACPFPQQVLRGDVGHWLLLPPGPPSPAAQAFADWLQQEAAMGESSSPIG